MSRGEAHRLLDQNKVNESYRRAGILVNDDGEVPIDESSQCYKKSNDVIDAIAQANLARIETRLWPLASLKGSESGVRRSKRERKNKDKARAQDRHEERSRKRR
jgi:tRNA-splicing ligase RtcB